MSLSTHETDSRVESLLARYRAPVLAGMRAALARPDARHLRFARYHLGWEDADGNAVDATAGKMLRPALCLLSCEAVGGSIDDALPAAVAIELLHNFTLIHDDIEDKSETRHGRPTLWRMAGIEQAINAGDGLFALAQRTLLELRECGLTAARVLQAAQILDDACIALCEGQSLDIAFESRTDVTLPEYEAMIAGKTSALLGASAGIGALCGDAAPTAVESFTNLGLLLGLAFQLQDDVLGVWGEPDRTGKSARDDVYARKKSYPVAFALDRLTVSDRDEFQRLYATADTDPATTERIVTLIEQSGARTAATETATKHARDALGAITAVEINPDRRADIEALATFFVSRAR